MLATAFKEGTTVLLALLISITAVWLLVGAFHNASTVPAPLPEKTYATLTDPQWARIVAIRARNAEEAKTAFERQREVLAYIFTLMGTVIGFYFGRVPAEKRAEAAEGQLDAARSGHLEAVKGKEKADAKLEGVKGEVDDLELELQALQAGAAAGPQAARIEARVGSLKRRLAS